MVAVSTAFSYFYIHMNSSRGSHSDHVFSFCLRLAFSCEKVVWKIKVNICGKRLTGMMEKGFFFSLSLFPSPHPRYFLPQFSSKQKYVSNCVGPLHRPSSAHLFFYSDHSLHRVRTPLPCANTCERMHTDHSTDRE